MSNKTSLKIDRKKYLQFQIQKKMERVFLVNLRSKIRKRFLKASKNFQNVRIEFLKSRSDAIEGLL